MYVSESLNLKQQTNAHPNVFERVDNSECESQVIEINISNEITRAVIIAVMAVENCMHDSILTSIDKMVVPRGEMAVKSVTGSTGQGTISEIQNLNRRDFLGNIGNTPLTPASSRLVLDNEIDRNDETRNNGDVEDGDFPALRSNYDRRAHAHHSASKHFLVF